MRRLEKILLILLFPLFPSNFAHPPFAILVLTDAKRGQRAPSRLQPRRCGAMRCGLGACLPLPLSPRLVSASSAASCPPALSPLPACSGQLQLCCRCPGRESENACGYLGEDELPQSDKPMTFCIKSAISSSFFLNNLLMSGSRAALCCSLLNPLLQFLLFPPSASAPFAVCSMLCPEFGCGSGEAINTFGAEPLPELNSETKCGGGPGTTDHRRK